MRKPEAVEFWMQFGQESQAMATHQVFFLGLFFVGFETWSSFIAQTARFAQSNSQSSCLSLPNARIISVGRHIRTLVFHF